MYMAEINGSKLLNQAYTGFLKLLLSGKLACTFVFFPKGFNRDSHEMHPYELIIVVLQIFSFIFHCYYGWAWP